MTNPNWSPGTQTPTVEVLRSALAKRGPNWEFVDYSGEKYTLGFLDAQSTSLAHALRASGARAGECVISILDNCVEQLLLLFACAKIGAVHVPLNTAYKGEYLRHQVADSRAAVLVAEKEYVERLIAIEGGLPDARVLLIKGELPEGMAAHKLEMRMLADVLVPTEEPTGHESKPGDLAMLVYTAGTTGPSKGCMISQNYLCNQARQLATCLHYDGDDVVWTPLPGFHMNQYSATVLSSMMVGGKCAIYPRFSVSRFWDELERVGATVTHILSSMVRFVAEAPDNPASLRYKGKLRVAGGAPFPEELQTIWRERFAPKHVHAPVGYGLTECAIVTSVDMTVPRPTASSGTHNDDFEVMIVDDDDAEVAADMPGEILVRPKKPHVMFEGYWGRPAETMKVLKNFWFHTGDIGKFDADGWFYFLDRKKDYLRRRGENISSMEVEGVFSLHPAIQEVAVHAVLADLEDDVKATIVLVEGAALTEEELCRWSVENLPYFAVPRFIEFRAALPKNPVGRVLKYELRDQGITEATWDRDTSSVELVKR
ncbi:AMP-binding protein [Sphingomonas koreensis]|uniref:AMP-binding protein n=1 Tax=Sphingomonas koreensis TaxID=93064 RepID=UPI000F7EFAA0|nr:AMP-binding protein [Sphingomonas koreensis]RSX63242.1 ATP-dependent acyl-CoA ligase [Sphingomonas koreensis]RSX74648.1 ATP-dependent acyl-CoA ligase [Sphingomonas koreensis]RSX78705.1 ATP-dependent acyl-CoA ligase [Sphingomonas koreensis]